jgi:hypothetical protein
MLYSYPPNDFMHTHGYWQSWWYAAAPARARTT